MISSKELHATLDEKSECLNFELHQNSLLQKKAATLIEKINTNISNNERILVKKIFYLKLNFFRMENSVITVSLKKIYF